MTRPSSRFLGLMLLALLVAGSSPARAQDHSLPFADYRTESWFLPQSPSLTGGAAASLFNPATLALNDRPASDFWWNDSELRGGPDSYGLAMGRNLGFALNTTTWGVAGDRYTTYDYQLGLARGTRVGAFGLAYRWAHGETQRTPRQKALSVGFVSRPDRRFSLGLSGVKSLESTAAQSVFDLGVRPLGRNWLTLFADWTANSGQKFFGDGTWGAGLELRPVAGLHLGLRARERTDSSDIDYSVMVGVTLADFNTTGMARYNQDGDLTGKGFLLRSNPSFSGLDAELPAFLQQDDKYLQISLENKVLTYQRYRWFDDTRVAWLDLMGLLDRAGADSQVRGVVLNLAGFRSRPSLLWEFRRKLEELQAAGKEVVIHCDRLNQGTYYLASVADRLTMDPLGGVELPGLVLSRSYLKGTLEKLGIGFQEHRYFKYKSAAETLSRDSMSDADREQRQRIVDVIYEELRRGSAGGRDLDLEYYDAVVDDLAQLTAQGARQEGLVDAVGRWDDLTKWVTKERRGKLVGPALLPPPRAHYDDVWGAALRIPVVFAVGGCDMDTGIKGRATSAYLRSLVKDPTVVAVVLRADSPGGDPLPSDLVADAVRKLREAGKPVIVSQGDVAASGGYWISMDGTRILTTPLTITGSIGVISGWVWDDGAAAKLGVTSDVVSRGRHADLFGNVSLPLLGSLPRRPMNSEELQRTETVIRGMYDDFVGAVARGRGLEFDAVHEVAQGRVWMGGDAIRLGLCDQFGTLGDAIKLACSEAGVPAWRDVEIVEYPPRQLFEMPQLLPDLPGISSLAGRLERWVSARLALGAGQDSDLVAPAAALLPGLGLSETDHVLRVGSHPGLPLLELPPELLPDGWKDWE